MIPQFGLLKICVDKVNSIAASTGTYTPADAIKEIRERMTASGGHIRQIDDARSALADAVKLYNDIQNSGFKMVKPRLQRKYLD